MKSKSTQKKYVTESGIPLKNAYRPEDIAGLDYLRDLGDPGEAPYTRGPYPEMYRSRLWRIAQLMGSGKVEDSRDRVAFSHEIGGDWAVFEEDQLTTVHMWDPDHPEVIERKDDVGLTGSPILGLPDYEVLLEPFELDKVYFHMLGTPWMNANVYVVAEKRGVPLRQLHGTGQGEMFLPYLSTPYKDMPPPRCRLRNNCDVVEFNVQNVPHVVPISCAGHNARANGIAAHEELAIVLAWNVDHIEYILKRGRMKIDDFAHALGGVNYSIARDFFEEIAKLRAARRMWYKLLKERYNAQNPRSFRLRIHGYTADRDYTREQPLVNIVRTTYRTMAAALGGCQSLGAGPYDEAITSPTEEALLMAIRTQQVIQHESGIAQVADPLAGSYYVESLTNELEERAWAYLQKIEDAGGMVKTLETGWLHREATRGALEQERRLESGERKLVGFNCFRTDEEVFEVRPHRASKAWEEAMAQLEKIRRERDNGKLRNALDELRRVVEKPDENQFPAMMEAVKAHATVGEIGEVYRDIWGLERPDIGLEGQGRKEMEVSKEKIRVLIAKTSLDGHWRGVVTVAAALRDAGMEVIYAGQATKTQILQAALQEDVDVIGLNIGGRFGHVGELIQMLKEKGLGDLLIIAGGPLLKEDIPELKQLGVDEVFLPGSRTQDIVAYVSENVSRE